VAQSMVSEESRKIESAQWQLGVEFCRAIGPCPGNLSHGAEAMTSPSGSSSSSGATKIMVIRHAEKPDTYNNQKFNGVDEFGNNCGKQGAEDLVTLGWQRSGALITLFAPPWGPQKHLATPVAIFASDPSEKSSAATPSSDGPSQRPYQTVLPLSAVLAKVPFNHSFKKSKYPGMVTAALACSGAVLICWQHEDIPIVKNSGITYEILTQTKTPLNAFKIPTTWPGHDYDMIWVFDRPSGVGQITGFEVVYQKLLAGDHDETAETAPALRGA
jgi:hypothetical protein